MVEPRRLNCSWVFREMAGRDGLDRLSSLVLCGRVDICGVIVDDRHVRLLRSDCGTCRGEPLEDLLRRSMSAKVAS